MLLSIILPCYNEGAKVLDSMKKIAAFMKNKNKPYEIIIVNDGSKNNTKDILFSDVKLYLKELLKQNNLKRYEIISYDNNRGKGYAIKQGIKSSTGDIVLFMDVDLSTDLSAIDDVYTYSSYDLVIGSRKIKGSNLTKKQPFVRQVVGNCCRVLTNIIVPLNIIDTQCGFKAIKGDFAREIVKKQTVDRFAFDVEYLYMAKLNKKSIKEIPVIWENDEDSKVSVINTSIDFFKSLFKIRFNKKRYKMGEIDGKYKN